MTRSRSAVGLLALGLAALATASRAAEAPATMADLRCIVVVALVMSNNSNPQMQAAAPLAMTYYLGRIKGREPATNIEARLTEEFAAAQGKDIRADAQRCGAEMSAMSKESAALAAHLRSTTVAPTH
jgi:mono/diheme cytochrome c family protein